MPPALRAFDERLLARPSLVQLRLCAGRTAHCAPPVGMRVCGLGVRLGAGRDAHCAPAVGMRMHGLGGRGKAGEMASSDRPMAASGVVARRLGARDREEQQNACAQRGNGSR